MQMGSRCYLNQTTGKKGLLEVKNVDVTYSSTSPKTIDSQS